MAVDTTKSSGAKAFIANARFHERPVFVDEHGRRDALVRALVALAAVSTFAWLVALALTAFGWSGLPGLPFSDVHRNQAAPIPVARRAPAPELVGPRSVRGSSATNAAGRPAAVPGSPASATSRSTATAVDNGSDALAGSRKTSGPRSVGPFRPPHGSPAPAGRGGRQAPGSGGGPANPPVAAPADGTGSGPGRAARATPLRPPAESAPATPTPSGNVPAEEAHGGNSAALAKSKGEPPN